MLKEDKLRITFDNALTSDVLRILPSILASLESPISIEHSVNPFQTIIISEIADVVVNNGLSSGYVGEGSRATVEVLQLLGIDLQTAENIAFTSPKGFKVELKKSSTKGL